MSFNNVFNTINNILIEKCNIRLDVNDYDSLIVKKMSKTNCIGKSVKSHQSHIAITGNQMNIFPYIYQKDFIENDNKKIKNFFVFKAPVRIFKKNCDYMDPDNNINFVKNEYKEEEMCIYPRSGGDQVQLSMKNEDTRDFIEFRKLIEADDYLVFLKYEEKLLYDVFAIKEKDGIENFYKQSIFEYKENKNTFITKTSIDYDDIESDSDNKESLNTIDKPHQRIFFGAPGTGKSYCLNREAEKYFGENYDRVTFHPNYMYGNFVGAFRPFPVKTGEIYSNGIEKESVIYRYIPGPFMKILIEAMKYPEKNYLLIIEEINRANTAAVFGDFFQLLDRKNGKSEYFIVTSEDIKSYLENEFENLEDEQKKYIKSMFGNGYEHLVLPKNLYIWATMNSADQGVMPMDTAFKRRWEFEYIGIDDALDNPEVKEKFRKYYFKIKEGSLANWDDFRKAVNKRLETCKVPEDKLIGPYFISESILESGDIDKITETVKRKVLMYIYDDAGKAHRSKLFNAEKSGTYSELCKHFDENGEAIFKNPLDLKEKNIGNGFKKENVNNIRTMEQKNIYTDGGNQMVADPSEKLH